MNSFKNSMICRIILIACIISAQSFITNNQEISNNSGNDHIYEIKSSAKPIEDLLHLDYTQVQYSGYLNINQAESYSSLFYTFYGKKNVQLENLNQFPLIIILGANPFLSTVAIEDFLKNGPYHFGFDNGFVVNTKYFQYQQLANTLYIDYMIGSGFSYATAMDELPKNADQISQQLFNALLEFFNLETFQGLQKSDLYIISEEYGGKVAMKLSKQIIEYQKNKHLITFNYKGLQVGNYVGNFIEQISNIDTIAYNRGLISSAQKTQLHEQLNEIKIHYTEGRVRRARDVIQQYLIGNYFGNVNMQNIGRFDSNLIGTEHLHKLTQNADFKGMFSSIDKNIPYKVFNFYGYDETYEDYLTNDQSVLEYLLDNKLKVQIFCTQDNLLINCDGIQNQLANLKWSGADDFNKAELKQWHVLNKFEVIGMTQDSGNLHFKMVKENDFVENQSQYSETRAARYIDMIQEFILY